MILLLWREESSPAPPFKSISSLVLSLFYDPTLTSVGEYWKNYSFDCPTFVGKVMSLLFYLLFMFVIAFLTRRKCFLILWLQSLSTVILDPKKIKSATVSIFSPSICHEMMVPDATILVFRMLSFKPTFNLIFAVCNFMCSETLYFAFKCDSKIPGGI